MKIAVIGTGYVGLVAGACFADSGNDVWCVDIDESKVQQLSKGEVPIYEPGLDPIVKRNLKEARLHFTTDLDYAVKRSQLVFLAVGTPPLPDGNADLSQVLGAAAQIGASMNGFKLIINKSTVPLGTSDRIRAIVKEHTDHPFEMVANPEFLKEGTAIDDFVRPDRVVVGADSDRAREMMGELYAPFVRNNNPMLFMDLRSAELTKYASNAMLALRISFMNELSRLAEAIGADIDTVRRGMGADVRIGKHFLFAGAGYGGSCFPKDVKALVRTGQDHGCPLSILEAADSANEAQKRVLFAKIHRHFDGDLRGRRFGIWGLAFKPNTDDMRDAPALTIVPALVGAGAKVRVVDPQGKAEGEALLPGVHWADDAYKAAHNADCVVILTEWNEFRALDLAKLARKMTVARLADLRNIYNQADAAKAGFVAYTSVGR